MIITYILKRDDHLCIVLCYLFHVYSTLTTFEDGVMMVAAFFVQIS